MTFIKSPFNYIGGKYRLLEELFPLFPKNYHRFIELFAGGLNVGINSSAESLIVNDINSYLIDFYRYLYQTDFQKESLTKRIEELGLSNSNKEAYLCLKDEFNKTHQPLDFFLLSCHSFDHKIRFNQAGEFNMPFGKRTVTKPIAKNLEQFTLALKEKEILFSTKDYKNFDYDQLEKGDLVYCDPPYFNSDADYMSFWTKEDDEILLKILDELNQKGVYFAFSNFFFHKGKVNEKLIYWSKDYSVHFIRREEIYKHSTHQVNEKEKNSIEVLVTNY